MTWKKRIQNRLHKVCTFSATGTRSVDHLKLAIAGFARNRPFGGPGAYGRIMRCLGNSVVPQFGTAPGVRMQISLLESVDLMVYEEIVVEGIYPMDLIRFQPDVVVDCGACCGLFSIWASRVWPMAEYHLFEPNPENVEKARYNLGLNQFRAQLHVAAVGVEQKTVEFEGGGFGGRVTGSGEHTIQINQIDFPAWLEQLQVKKLVLKIDIEGAEAELLPVLAPVLPQHTAIFLETHHTDGEVNAYLQPLVDAGFLHHVQRRREDPSSAVPWIEHVLQRP